MGLGTVSGMNINFRETVSPLFIMCDKSSSIGQSGFNAAMNQALLEVHTALARTVGFDHVRLSFLSFSDNAEVLLPLCKATDVKRVVVFMM